jgi:FtsP/CotA-like multicopper oxidase with cupredoxin domain
LGAANKLGQYIPLAKPEKWVDLNGVVTTDDYYEVAVVEYSEKMHSDLPKATRLRGYVQLSTAANPGKHIALTYPDNTPILNAAGLQVYAYDKPHFLGPIIKATKGTAVRMKFTNYLPAGAGGNLFIPVDTTVNGAGVDANNNAYGQNRANIHLVGGQAPWISAGLPHQWVAPAADAAQGLGLGKGVSSIGVPDMAAPEAGSTTLYFPNDMSARFMFYQDRTSGLTRLNTYAGMDAGYMVTDLVEQDLITRGVIPADQIPLIIMDRSFVPDNIAQQDAKWNKDSAGVATTQWGAPGDLWFPHVYEANQDVNSATGFSPVGRFDFGPLYWPIFPQTEVLPAGNANDPTMVMDAFFDTPVINGTAYPTLTVDPKAYRFRILNASTDRYLNLSLFKADPTVQAPMLDQNGNAILDAAGNPIVALNTEVKMIPAIADGAGNPVGWGIDLVTKLPVVDATGQPAQWPLPQYPAFQRNNMVESSGPARAWPIDARVGGTPDPTLAGPDFIGIGNDGGFNPNPVDIPAQPVTFEANRRSVTVGAVYGYGMYMGPSERVDAVVDFSAYAGQTLILYNDAPAPNPWHDERNDYYTGAVDMTGTGGSYSTKPGYGPNTRTMMQIKVNAVAAAPVTPFVAANLVTELPKAYKASHDEPIVPQMAYNAAFGTSDPDFYGHAATGTLAQPTFNIIKSVTGGVSLTAPVLGIDGGTVTAGGVVVMNAIPGSGTGYDPKNPPLVVFNNVVNGVDCLPVVNPVNLPVSASATAVVDPVTRQITNLTNWNAGSGYVCAPIITFATPTVLATTVSVTAGGSGYTSPVAKVGSANGVGSGATAGPVSFTQTAAATVDLGGSGYTAQTMATVTGGSIPGATATVSITAGAIAGVMLTPSTGYTSAPTVTISDAGSTVLGGTGVALTVTVDATTGAAVAVDNGGASYVNPVATVTSTDFPSATATVTTVGGVITAVTLSPATGYTTAPTVNITDAGSVIPGGSGAVVTTGLVAGTGVVTGLSLATLGSGYTVPPVISITDIAGGSGTGAQALVQSKWSTVGVGATATVGVVSNVSGQPVSISYPVHVAAEQELFDTRGRYNTTGGVEMPLITAMVQTTVPLNYIDTATEILNDNEVQIWKIVDNGFYANTIHWDFVEVQVINRVGWDGTVKPTPGSDLGWKDTIKLNQLEDLVIAMRAKRPAIPFGLPKSKRLLDPSKPLGGAGSGLGFTRAAGLPWVLDGTNVERDFDNEYAWNSALLSHSENDFTRPIVYMPTVTVPAMPTTLVDAMGDGSLVWTDTTPKLDPVTLRNPQNEVGYKVYTASADAFGNAGAFTPALDATGKPVIVPANTTKWTALVPPVAGTYYGVTAFNAAGESQMIQSAKAAMPAAPTNFWATPVVFNSVTLNFTGASTSNKIEVVRGGVVIATLPGTATVYVDNTVTAVQTYSYVIRVTNALGTVDTAALPVTTPMEFVAAPTLISATVNTAGTLATLRWTDNANNENRYWVDVTKDGVALPQVVLNRSLTQGTATAGALVSTVVTVPGSVYDFSIRAVKIDAVGTPSTSVALTGTLNLAPPAAPAAPTALVGTPFAVLRNGPNVRLTWVDNATTESSYLVTITDNTAVPATTTQVVRGAGALSGTTMTYNAAVVAAHSYTFTVAAQTILYGQTTASAALTGNVDVIAPAAPTSVNAVAGAAGSLSAIITWVDAPQNATSYDVMRATVTAGVAGAFGRVGTVLPGVQTFTNTGLTLNRVYQYQVIAKGVVTPSVGMDAPSTVTGQ